MVKNISVFTTKEQFELIMKEIFNFNSKYTFKELDQTNEDFKGKLIPEESSVKHFEVEFEDDIDFKNEKVISFLKQNCILLRNHLNNKVFTTGATTWEFENKINNILAVGNLAGFPSDWTQEDKDFYNAITKQNSDWFMYFNSYIIVYK